MSLPKCRHLRNLQTDRLPRENLNLPARYYTLPPLGKIPPSHATINCQHLRHLPTHRPRTHLPERVPRPSGGDSPTAPVVRVRPNQVAHGALVGHLHAGVTSNHAWQSEGACGCLCVNKVAHGALVGNLHAGSHGWAGVWVYVQSCTAE